MKKLIAVVVLTTTLFVSAIAQEDNASTIWAVHQITTKAAPIDEITQRIFDHDEKFHEGKSILLNIMTGDDSGDMLWAYGPLTYTEMDNMKLAEGHEQDNADLANKYIDEYKSMTLWKFQPEVSVDFGDEVEDYTTRTHSSFKLKRGTYATWKGLAEKHIEVYKKHKLAEVLVFTAVYGTKDGHDLLLISPFKNFASFDEDWGYKAKFEAVHGEGSLKETNDKINEIIEESYSYLTVVAVKE